MPKKTKKVDITDSESGKVLATTEIEVDERGTPISRIPSPSTEGSTDKTKEQLEDENADLKAKLEFIADSAFEKEKERLAMETGKDTAYIETPEQLEAFKQIVAKEKPEKREYWGTAPLNEAQRTGRTEKGYESYGEMLKDLRKRERLGDKEAKRILEELWKKAHGKLSDLPTEPSKEQREEYHEPTVGEGFYKIRKKKREEE